jgi:hypothetical protein
VPAPREVITAAQRDLVGAVAAVSSFKQGSPELSPRQSQLITLSAVNPYGFEPRTRLALVPCRA